MCEFCEPKCVTQFKSLIKLKKEVIFIFIFYISVTHWHRHTNAHTHTHTTLEPEGLWASQDSGPSLRHVSAASQFCLFKDQAVLLGKWFWRRARATRISKSLVSHQNRCNFIFFSSSMKQRSLSLPLSDLPASTVIIAQSGTEPTKYVVCFFSPPTFCAALLASLQVGLQADPSGVHVTHT